MHQDTPFHKASSFQGRS